MFDAVGPPIYAASMMGFTCRCCWVQLESAQEARWAAGQIHMCVIRQREAARSMQKWIMRVCFLLISFGMGAENLGNMLTSISLGSSLKQVECEAGKGVEATHMTLLPLLVVATPSAFALSAAPAPLPCPHHLYQGCHHLAQRVCRKLACTC